LLLFFEVSWQKQQRNNNKNIQTHNISHRAIKRTINLYPSPLKSYGDFIFYIMAITEMVHDLIWAPDFFGPQEIWDPRNLKNLSPA